MQTEIAGTAEPVRYSFRELLAPLESPEGLREARKLAMMSSQVKIEQAVLAEIMFNGNQQFPHLAFQLEEMRKDLAIRLRWPDSRPGALVEWVEAKMCYTECLSRSLTEHGKQNEYLRLLIADAEKQSHGVRSLPHEDQGARLTLLLLVIHRKDAVPGQKYYPGFEYRRGRSADEIMGAARKHVQEVIAPDLRERKRNLVEDFTVSLDKDRACHLLVYVFSTPTQAGRSRQ